jgi:hypothetical protein
MAAPPQYRAAHAQPSKTGASRPQAMSGRNDLPISLSFLPEILLPKLPVVRRLRGGFVSPKARDATRPLAAFNPKIC